MKIATCHLKSPISVTRGCDTPASELHGYEWSELERGVSHLTRDFHGLQGGDPARELASKYNHFGVVNVLDAGCGTGAQLYDLIDYARYQYGVDVDRVFADGVSDHDFSMISESLLVLKANRTGRINYELGNLNDTELLPLNAYDIAISYEVLLHNEEPLRIVRNIFRALRPGGVMFFNAGDFQEPQIVAGIEQDKEFAGSAFSYQQSVPSAMSALYKKVMGANFAGRSAFKLVKAG